MGQIGPLPDNVEVHVVATFDQNDTSAGPNGTLWLYRDGAPIGSAELPSNLDLNTTADDNNWLGRSQWNDPVFDGLFNELRLYDSVLTPGRVQHHFQLGPDVIPEPATATVLMGAIGLLGRRRLA